MNPSPKIDWSIMYMALKVIQDINIEVTGERKNIISLDLQLYSKYMQLRSRHENHEEFVFRLGERHTVFAMLKVIGKYIEESGLDKILVDSDIYRKNTLK